MAIFMKTSAPCRNCDDNKIRHGADSCLRLASLMLQERMGFLGLDQTPVKDDNMFQRMFWPSDNAGDTDTLGKQGFWVCGAIGLFSLLTSALQGHPIVGLLTALFFCLGGIGVREHSQPAAVLVAAVYLLNIVAAIASGLPPGALTIILSLLLLANVRATYIAAKWADRGDPSVMPERFNETFADKLVDQMPARVWPIAKIPFFCIAGLYLVLTLLGAVMLAMGVPQKMRALQQQKRPSAVLVTPSR